MDLDAAQALFEGLFTIRSSSSYPFTKEMETNLRDHSLATAQIAKKIAEKTTYLDHHKAYIFGLLHDYGRVKDEFNGEGFHGLVGYEELMKLGHPDIAQICLSHCFYEKDFDPNFCTQSREMVLGCKDLVMSMEYDDYDRLIQLADMTNQFGKPCTIEHRNKSIVERYKISNARIEPAVQKLNEIKAYFDNICKEDVYKIIGVEI